MSCSVGVDHLALKHNISIGKKQYCVSTLSSGIDIIGTNSNVITRCKHKTVFRDVGVTVAQQIQCIVGAQSRKVLHSVVHRGNAVISTVG